MPEQVPIRWQGEWRPALAKRLEGTPVNCVVAGSRIVYPAPAPLALAPFGKTPWDAPGPIAIEDAAWPRVKTGGDGASAGPTGAPWIDANGWLAQLARAMVPGKPVWIAPARPAEEEVVQPASYSLAVADSAAFGALPLLTFDERSSLSENWARFVGALRFFETHREWRSWNALARLGVVSDFSGANRFLGTEFLNLAARRGLPYRVLPKSGLVTARLAGLTTVIYLDEQPPAAAVRDMLRAFGRSGLLIASPRTAGSFNGSARTTREWDDPYLIAAELHLMMSRRQDLYRLYNAMSVMAHYIASPDGNRAVVHLINYSTRRSVNAITLWLERAWREARVWTVDSTSPGRLDPVAANRGIELHLPPFPVYAAIELGG